MVISPEALTGISKRMPSMAIRRIVLWKAPRIRSRAIGADEKSKAAREALKQYIATLFELATLDGGAEAATAILDLETRLAEVQWERTELRNAEKRYNRKTLAELAEMTPELDWTTFINSTNSSV